MNVASRIAAFAATLVAVFAVSVWVGHTYGPTSDFAVPPPPATSEHPAHDGNGR